MEVMVLAAEFFAFGSREGAPISKRQGLDDEAWLRVFAELADGRSRALQEVYDAIGTRLYGLALWRTGSAADAADVVQDVFVQLAESRERLRSVQAPERWLMTVTRRRAIDSVRRSRRRDAQPLETAGFVAAPKDGGDHMIDAERACRLLERLPVTQREVIYLRHFEECTFKTIGAIVGVPTFTAASRYRLGMIRLRRLMGADDEQ